MHWVNTESIEQDGAAPYLQGMDGIVVPGGFGDRGVQGKILAAQYARENKIPYLGLCYGMQMAVIELARTSAACTSANSTEIDPRTPHPVIDIMADQRDIADMGGTMRLGLYPCELVPGTQAAAAYGEPLVQERHRHRWEFNNAYRERLRAAGLVVSGTSPDGRLVEIIELRDHPWFVGSQFHPELKSRPTRPASRCSATSSARRSARPPATPPPTATVPSRCLPKVYPSKPAAANPAPAQARPATLLPHWSGRRVFFGPKLG